MSPNLAEAHPFEHPAVQAAETNPILHAVPNLLGQEEATPPQGDLSLVSPVLDGVDSASELKRRFISADSIPELFTQRQQARQNATRILAQNSHLLHTGRTSEVPSAVNALGTAEQVAEVKQKSGVDSPEYREVYTGLKLDNTTLTDEVATTNIAAYFPPIEREFRGITEGYYSHGLSISTMTRNGLSPLASKEEQPRRIIEDVEENGTLVPIGGMIAKHGLKGMVEVLPIEVEPELPIVSVEVTTISRCPIYAKEAYEINPKDSHGGYRPAMDGMAIRRSHFKDDAGHRKDEQVIISGTYITEQVIEEVLVEDGVIEPGQELTVDEMLALQRISVNDGSVVDFVKRLDKKASEVHDLDIFVGEPVPAGHPKDYDKFMQASEERREQLKPIPTALADFQIDLVEKGTDTLLADAIVSNFLQDKFLAIAKKNPELAEAIFDKATAEGFSEVARLEAAGQHQQASRMQAFVERNAPDVSYCGAGSCGLEGVEDFSPAGNVARRLGLRGRMLRNRESACKNCTAKELYHDYNGNTVCVSCKSTKLNGQGVRHDRDKEKSAPKAIAETTKKAGEEASLVSRNEKRKKSNKDAANKKVPHPEMGGELVLLHKQPSRQSPAA
jgi:hypothetical protein